jgi:hypothetical protein
MANMIEAMRFVPSDAAFCEVKRKYTGIDSCNFYNAISIAKQSPHLFFYEIDEIGFYTCKVFSSKELIRISKLKEI